jgi:hypothetical protein
LGRTKEIQDLPYKVSGVISYQDYLTIIEFLDGRKMISTLLRELCHLEAEGIRKLKEDRSMTVKCHPGILGSSAE